METSVLTTGLLAATKPETFFDLKNGQGTFLYNHNVKEVPVTNDGQGNIKVTADEEAATGKMWEYDSLRVEYPRTGDNVFATLITVKYPANTESKLVNEYQSAVLGLMDESAKIPYEDFLRDRIAIRDMVNDDCEANNVPLDL